MSCAIVLAGGLGTRLGNLAGNLPKPLVAVAGRPFLDYVLDLLCRSGIERIIMAVSHRRELIQAQFGSSYKGVPVAYSIETSPLGTGGAILKCFRNEDLERALVLNGDTYFPVDIAGLMRIHETNRELLTVALCRVTDTSRYGAVTCDHSGHIETFHEKNGVQPGLINGGVYVVERAALDRYPLPERFSFERDHLQRHVAALRPLGVEYDTYFIDIGVPADLQRARQELPTRA